MVSLRMLSPFFCYFPGKEGPTIFSDLFSREQLTGILRWTLYSVLFLLTMLIQTIVLPQIKLTGITLCIVPIGIVCVAVREGAEKGALFALITGLIFCLSGISEGPLYIVLFTLSAALSGAICDSYYTRSFFPGLVLSLMSLALCEGLVFLFRVSTAGTDGALWHTVLLPAILLSLLAYPLIYLSAWAISRIGR